MRELVLHQSTQLELDQLARRPAHALMLTGSEGMGKMAVARQLAASALRLPDGATLKQYPHVHIIAADGQTISIAAIRELLNLTKLKIPGANQGITRVIIIDEAQRMTVEAQNALLKLLEEPPAGTMFLLNVASVQNLLPTVRSRAQELAVKQPAQQALEAYFATHGFDAQKVRSAYLMSGGLPGLMHALLHDSDQHPLIAAVARARELLRASTFERLAAVDTLSKQKEDCTRLLFVLQQMAHAAIVQTAQKQASAKALQQWQRVLTAAYDADTALQTAAQPKLVLTNLMLAL